MLTLRNLGVSFGLASVMALGGCPASGPTPEEQAAKKKMADELVTCRNEKSACGDKLAELQGELKRLKEQLAAANTLVLPPTQVDGKMPGQPSAPLPEGNISTEALLKTVKANSPQLRSCYEGGLKRNPNLQYISAVTVKFALQGTGQAANVAFSPRTSDAEMEKCMAEKIGKWKFPQFSGSPVQIEAPVNLVAK